MSEPRRVTLTHNLGNVRFVGATDAAATSIKGPVGKKGWLVDVGIRATETFACDTTTAKIRLGTTADPDHYAELVIADATAATNVFNVDDDRDAIKGEEIPSDTQIEVSFVSSGNADVDAVLDPPSQAVTNSSAGAGDVYAVIDWY